MLIEGMFAAVPTPFYPDERIYFRKLEANISHYSRSLLAGMVVLGSTGEAVALTDAESREVLRTAIGAAAPDKVMIAGVAWAQHRGVEAVEVGIDGTWPQATLAAQDTIDTWRQWYYPWQATAGKHTLQVRATDKSGYTQTSVYQKPEPNGATGYHTVTVTVA